MVELVVEGAMAHVVVVRTAVVVVTETVVVVVGAGDAATCFDR